MRQGTKEKAKKQPKTIPEEVKHKLDQSFQELDKPIYTMFKLLEALGCRGGELAKIPLNCLKKREGVNRTRIATGKQDNSEQEQDLPEELVPLVQQQQAFIRDNFGEKFPWLFCNFGMKRGRKCYDDTMQIFPVDFQYFPKQILKVSYKLNNLIQRAIEKNDIRTKDGTLAHVTLHEFRRTYATVARRMGKRTDQIQHSLRHLNPDMQDHYVHTTPQELEKELILINQEGQSISYKTNLEQNVILREWKIREIEMGLCGRPNIQKSCENEYICLGCSYAFYSHEDIGKLESLLLHNQKLLEQSIKNSQSDSRRAYSAQQQIQILTKILNQIKANTEEI